MKPVKIHSPVAATMTVNHHHQRNVPAQILRVRTAEATSVLQISHVRNARIEKPLRFSAHSLAPLSLLCFNACFFQSSNAQSLFIVLLYCSTVIDLIFHPLNCSDEQIYAFIKHICVTRIALASHSLALQTPKFCGSFPSFVKGGCS